MGGTDKAMRIIQDDIASAAQRLAEANHEAEPHIEKIYLFPSDQEIRLVEVDPTTPPSDEVEPFYFEPDLAGGIPFRSAIALIRPDEESRIKLPRGWGSWSAARQIWPAA